MKNTFLYLSFLAIAVFSFLSCEREPDNPWDEMSKIPPESWAPKDLETEYISITKRKLTWKYDGDDRLEGFKLDRKKGNDNWEIAYRTFEKNVLEWVDTNILPVENLSYSYRLYAYAGEYISAERTITIQSELIPSPSNMKFEKLSDKSVKVTWEDNSIGEQGFKLDRKVDQGEWQDVFAIIDKNKTFFIDTNVYYAPGKSINVYYRVYAYYGEYESLKVSGDTTSYIPSPVNFQITTNSISSVTLSWNDNSNGEDGFILERKYGNGSYEFLTKVTGTTFEDNDFNLFEDIKYKVYAYIGDYFSGYKTKMFYSDFPAPDNMEITQNNLTSVTLHWQDNSIGEDGFRIEKRYIGEEWQFLANTSDVSFLDEDIPLNKQIYYRVCAFYKEYKTDYIEGSVNSSIPAPTNFEMTPYYSKAAILTWEDNCNEEEGYIIERKVNTGSWEAQYAILGPNQTSFTDSIINLFLNQYSYKVYAYIGNYYSTNELLTTQKCGYTLLDERDGNEYGSLFINNQCWMDKNLAYLPSVSSSVHYSVSQPFYYVYGYEGYNVNEAKATANYVTYGVLYNWPAALTACPDGWHLPDNDEWQSFIDVQGGNSVAGGKLKETGTAHWNPPNTGATNINGFTAIPGGECVPGNGFDFIGDHCFFITSTVDLNEVILVRELSYHNTDIIEAASNKKFGLSLRCLKD